jgi:hypothetical protein
MWRVSVRVINLLITPGDVPTDHLVPVMSICTYDQGM